MERSLPTTADYAWDAANAAKNAQVRQNERILALETEILSLNGRINLLIDVIQGRMPLNSLKKGF